MGYSLSRRKQGAQSLRALRGGLTLIHVGLDLQDTPSPYSSLTRIRAF